MVTFKPLDENCPILQQLDEHVSPITLVNIFTVAPEDADHLIRAWENDAKWMKKQPGYISTQLHRAIGQSSMFMNYAIWDSVEDFRNAFNHPEFKETMAAYPSSAVASPHLFEKIAVPSLCTA